MTRTATSLRIMTSLFSILARLELHLHTPSRRKSQPPSYYTCKTHALTVKGNVAARGAFMLTDEWKIGVWGDCVWNSNSCC